MVKTGMLVKVISHSIIRNFGLFIESECWMPLDMKYNPIVCFDKWHEETQSERAFIFSLVSMDTSNPAVFVNAEFLKQHVGRRVRAVVQVMQSDGDKVIGKSTDEQQLVVKGYPPSPLSTFVEVIGIADSPQSIQAETWTNFGDTFDVTSFDKVCRLANGDSKHLFI
ncbi:replication protein A 14 kDa subunit B [Capsicum chacoense]